MTNADFKAYEVPFRLGMLRPYSEHSFEAISVKTMRRLASRLNAQQAMNAGLTDARLYGFGPSLLGRGGLFG